MDRPARLAFVDTETTGLSHLSRPWEIAVILRETDQVEIRELSAADPSYIAGRQAQTEYLFQVEYTEHSLPDGTERGALEIGGWRERGRGVDGAMYRDSLIDQGVLTAAGPEWSIARSVHKLLQDATIVGIGIHYDAEVLGRMFLRHGLDWQPWHYDIRDLKTMTRGYLRGLLQASGGRGTADDYQWASSDQLAAWMGVAPPADDERHTALGDARWAVRWWDAL